MIICRNCILFIFMSISTLSCSKGSIEHNLGIFHFKFKNYESAEKSFVNALVENPNLGISRYALALSFLPREQLKDSLTELNSLLKKNTSDEAKFKLFFAKAVVYSLLGELEPALNFYQKCLYLKPDSIEVKTNIELLFGEDGDGKGNALKSAKSKKKKDSSDSDGEGERSEDDPESQNEAEKKQQEESQTKKNLSPAELKRILKELQQQEKKVRAKGYEGQEGDGKNKTDKGKPW